MKPHYTSEVCAMEENKTVLSPEQPRKPDFAARIRRVYADIKPNLFFYVLAAVLAFAGKLFYSLASTRGLLFLLSPVTFLVSAFTGMPFTYDESVGYVNLSTGIVIGKSCAGMNYLILLYTMTVVSFLHYFKKPAGKLLLQVSALAGSWLLCAYATVARIVISISLLSAGDSFPFMKTETAHKIVGIVVYVTILLLYYSIADSIFRRVMKKKDPRYKKEEMQCKQ